VKKKSSYKREYVEAKEKKEKQPHCVERMKEQSWITSGVVRNEQRSEGGTTYKKRKMLEAKTRTN